MAIFSDLFDEWKKASPKEKLFIGAGGIGVVAILLYLHKQSSTQGPFTTATPASVVSSGAGGVGTGLQGNPTMPGQPYQPPTSNPTTPTTPTTPSKPTGGMPPVVTKPALPVSPVVKANPVKQPTTVTKTAARSTTAAPVAKYTQKVVNAGQRTYTYQQGYGGGGKTIQQPYMKQGTYTQKYYTTSGMGQGGAAINAGGQQTTSGILRYQRGY